MSKLILFQGDSITDAERIRNNDIFRGHGYATFVSAKLGLEFPNEYSFINRGIKNNTVIDLHDRRKEDIFDLKPAIMSILIGVNDAAVHNSTPEKQDGLSIEEYERIYPSLLKETMEINPNIQIMLIEPFLLPGELSNGRNLNIYPSFRKEVEARAEIARNIARKLNLPFVELQAKFDELCKSAPSSYWLYDGVHPTAAGHELIAREWIHTFSSHIL